MLAKLQATKEPGDETNNDKTQQVALLRTAANTGSLEMVEMILKKTDTTNDTGTATSQTNTTNGQEGTPISPPDKPTKSEATNQTKQKFLEKEYNALKRLLSVPAPKANIENSQTQQKEQNSGEQNVDKLEANTQTSTTDNPLDSIPFDDENSSSEPNIEGTESTAQPQPRPATMCPEGLDENFYINRNRRHCSSYEDENPDDVNKFQRNKKNVYFEEMSKNERLIKTMGAKKKRKHSVAKHL